MSHIDASRSRVRSRLGAAVAAAALAVSSLAVPGSASSSGIFLEPAWSDQFGTPLRDEAHGVAIGPDETVYVVGRVEGVLGDAAFGDDDSFVRAYRSDGMVLWTDQFGTADDDRANGVAVGPDGTIYVVGEVKGALPGEAAVGIQDGYLRAYHPDGTVLWTDQFGVADEETAAHAVAIASDGTIHVGGRTGGDLEEDQHKGQTDGFVRTYSSEGEPVWTRNVGTSSSDDVLGVAVGLDGTVYAVGETSGELVEPGGGGAFIAAFDASGVTLWEDQFGNDLGDAAFGVAVGPDGTVYVVGEMEVGEINDAFLRAYAPAGSQPTVLWTVHLASDEDDTASAVTVMGDGTIVVAGSTHGSLADGAEPQGDDDAFVAFFDSSGDPVWVDQFGSGGGDRALGTAAGSGSVAVVGLTSGDLFASSAGGRDAWVLAYHDPRDVIRLAGANRFATAAAVATHHYPNGADTVFVATGANFPDALAGAAPAGLEGAPLLLTSSIPLPTSLALDALDPADIVILGGTAVISPGDETALSAWAPVERLAGQNRYLTAIEISKWAYPTAGSADVVFVATGENFPDALAAGAAAAELGGPVLLTRPGSLPAEVAAEIQRLSPDKVFVIGGPMAVSSAVFDELSALAPTARLAGPTRYETAIEISQEAFPEPVDRVYIAVGTNFPDALAGAAVAAAWGAPVLLTPTDALPEAVAAEILRLDPTLIYILGGTAVVSEAVEDELRALLGI